MLIRCTQLAVLLCAGIDEVHLDLGHAGIFRSLCSTIGLTDRDQSDLFSLAVSELGPLAVNNPSMTEALDELREISNALQPLSSGTNLHVDLAEVRGYQYHTGVVFAAYTPGSGSEIARGGRYDGIGESFGRSYG